MEDARFGFEPFLQIVKIDEPHHIRCIIGMDERIDIRLHQGTRRQLSFLAAHDPLGHIIHADRLHRLVRKVRIVDGTVAFRQQIHRLLHHSLVLLLAVDILQRKNHPLDGVFIPHADEIPAPPAPLRAVEGQGQPLVSAHAPGQRAQIDEPCDLLTLPAHGRLRHQARQPFLQRQFCLQERIYLTICLDGIDLACLQIDDLNQYV